MLFTFPSRRIHDTAWFLSKTNVLVFGTVKLITIALSDNECKTYYRFIDTDDVEYTVPEDQVLDNQMVVPMPKYCVGDGVVYSYLNEHTEHEQRIDVIKHIEIHMYEKGVIEISYVMEHNQDEWVLEDEIISYGDPELKAVLDTVETNDENYTEYDFMDRRVSDV